MQRASLQLRLQDSKVASAVSFLGRMDAQIRPVRLIIKDLCLYKLINSHAVWLCKGGKHHSENESLFRMQNSSVLPGVPSSPDPPMERQDLEDAFPCFLCLGEGMSLVSALLSKDVLLQ